MDGTNVYCNEKLEKPRDIFGKRAFLFMVDAIVTVGLTTADQYSNLDGCKNVCSRAARSHI